MYVSFFLDISAVWRTVYIHAVLNECNDHIEYDVDSLDHCWYLCIAHTGFVCNSGEYIENPDLPTYRECRLSQSTSYNTPEAHFDYISGSMIERCGPSIATVIRLMPCYCKQHLSHNDDIEYKRQSTKIYQ